MSIINAIFGIVKNAIVISDLHIPYEHRDAFPFLDAVAQKIVPTTFINVGDEVDFHTLSHYPNDPDLYSSGHEFAETMKKLNKLEELFPKMVITRSNHGMRYVKTATERAGIPRAMLKAESELFVKPGWRWEYRADFRTVAGPVTVCHSHSTDALKSAVLLGTSVIQGHYHNSFCLGWADSGGRQLYGMTVGCLVDRESYSMAYAKEDRFVQMLGCGAIINGEPRLIRMGLTKTGRWDRKIKL